MSRAAVERPHSLEELLWWAERLACRGDLSKWERGFCQGIAAKSRRRNWRPTAKQEAALRRIVADMLDGSVVLIDTAA